MLNEAIIRRKVDGRAVMHEQLTRLLASMELPNLTLQVVPFDVGAHPSMDGAFSILGFPEETDPNIVYIEYQTGALYLEKPEEVRRYRLIFDRLRVAALPVDASRALIAGRADEMA